MLILTCPVCGAEGDETKYTYGHQAHIERPSADKATPESWEKYLFERENEKGLHAERWLHANGCDWVQSLVLPCHKIGKYTGYSFFTQQIGTSSATTPDLAGRGHGPLSEL